MPAPDLVTAKLTLTGRFTTASNATFLVSIGDTAVTYKPIAASVGFLAHREVAAYLVSEVLNWNTVPRTWLPDGPLELGMVELCQETDSEQTAVDLGASGRGAGHRDGVNHGLTFHSEHTLRMVLWGWIRDALNAEEIASLAARCSRLRMAGASGSEQ